MALGGTLYTAKISLKYRLSYLVVSLRQITYRTLIIHNDDVSAHPQHADWTLNRLLSSTCLHVLQICRHIQPPDSASLVSYIRGWLPILPSRVLEDLKVPGDIPNEKEFSFIETKALAVFSKTLLSVLEIDFPNHSLTCSFAKRQISGLGDPLRHSDIRKENIRKRNTESTELELIILPNVT